LLFAAASAHAAQQLKAAGPSSSLAKSIHRKLLAVKAAAAEAAQSSAATAQTWRGWWHDVPSPAANGQYNGWWHDVPNANPSGQFNGWMQDSMTPWVLGGR
jgi:hypothetical protein